MIQLIISTEVDVNAIQEQEFIRIVDVIGFDEEGNEIVIPTEQKYRFQCSPITEMVNGWLLLVNEPDDFDDIELAIEGLGDVQTVGAYNFDGSQYIYGKASRNHTIAKYHGKLKPKKVFNEQGDLISEIAYTLAEAPSVHVNKYMGWADRQL